MSLGPIMLDLEGTGLTAEDREILCHPAVGGVILFARNFESPDQVAALSAEIHRLREPRLLIAVDQEGGRVQRFREGFTRLPAAARFGERARRQPAQARRAAETVGWLMAAELLAVGVDFSFAPVLDLDRGVSRVIGDRALSGNVDTLCELAEAWVRGVHAAGMAAVGKHFPGHGSVEADSHTELPADGRPFGDIELADLVPFERLIGHGLDAIMPAHVLYPQIDAHPAGFSSFWLRRILRERLEFQGLIFSDDLNMAAAAAAGGFAERAQAAMAAGCDLLLVCNNRSGALEVIDSLGDRDDPTMHLRCLRMHGRGMLGREEVRLQPRWQQGMQAIGELEGAQAVDLDI